MHSTLLGVRILGTLEELLAIRPAMARRTAFALVLALLACCLSGSLQSSVPKASQLRGVHPDRLAHYQPGAGGSFTCVDGSKLIPFDFVNDDFCDCPDGSDEPGRLQCAKPRTASSLSRPCSALGAALHLALIPRAKDLSMWSPHFANSYACPLYSKAMPATAEA